MARWEEAHDALLDLYKFHNSPVGVDLINVGWYAPNVEEFDRLARGDIPGLRPPESYAMTAKFFRETFRDFSGQIAAMLFNADPIYVDPEMMRVALAAAETFEPEPLLATDVITEIGFLYLPVEVKSLMGGGQSFLDVVQLPDGRIAAAPPGSVKTRPDEDFQDASWRGCLWQMVPDSGLEIAFFGHTKEGLRFMRANVAPFGVDIPASDQGPAWYDFRFLQVLWRLMQQTISVNETRKPGGQFARRAERLNIEPKRVTVVTLRRPHPGEAEEHRDVSWTHRWIVGGHWRNQPYPSLGIHRQIWISPYVKGPDDMPLVLPKVRAFQLVR